MTTPESPTLTGAPWTPEPGAIVFLPEITEGMTDEQVYAFLSRDRPEAVFPAEPNEVIVAAADVRNGAMVALIPSFADLERLEVDGGEPLGELHITAFYLGDAVYIDDQTRADIVATLEELLLEENVVEAVVFGIGVFNPTSDEPAVILNVGGAGLQRLRDLIEEGLIDADAAYPEQHIPWVPHITLGYDKIPLLDVEEAAAQRMGPITIDRVRVAFGGEVTDIPLGVGVTASTEHVFHLPGQHDQRAHGHKTTISAGDRAAFDKKMRKARSGDKAYGSVRSSDELIGKQSRPGSGSWDTTDAVMTMSSIDDYQQNGFVVNAILREGRVPKATEFDSDGVGQAYAGRSAYEGLTSAMASKKTRLSDDIVVERGIRNPRNVFGDDWSDGGGNEGLTWDDAGFVSTTTSSAVSKHFSSAAHEGHIEGTPVVAKMYVPKGTNALRFGEHGSNPEYDWEKEVVLDRGMRYRIMNDHGLDAEGVHHVDVEVLGSSGMTASVDALVAASIGDPPADLIVDPEMATPNWIDDGPPVKMLRRAIIADGSLVTVFHLAGKHDQSTHGHGSRTTISVAEQQDFAKRRDKATSGKKVLKAAKTTDDFKTESRSVEGYQGSGNFINDELRQDQLQDQWTETVGDFDSMMAGSKLDRDVVVTRGIQNPYAIFGSDWNQDPAVSNAGLQWKDRGFVSTSVDTGVSDYFAQRTVNEGTYTRYSAFENQGVKMNILVPKGTGAVSFGKKTGFSDLAHEQELLLDRGLTFRIMADHGRVDGVRSIDVEVVPS